MKVVDRVCFGTNPHRLDLGLSTLGAEFACVPEPLLPERPVKFAALPDYEAPGAIAKTLQHPFAQVTLVTQAGKRHRPNEDGVFAYAAEDDALILCGCDGNSTEHGQQFRDSLLRYFPLFIENYCRELGGCDPASFEALSGIQEFLTLLSEHGEITLGASDKVGGVASVGSLKKAADIDLFPYRVASTGDIRQIIITADQWYETLDHTLANTLFHETLGGDRWRNLTLSELREVKLLRDFLLDSAAANGRPRQDLWFAKQVIETQLGMHRNGSGIESQLALVDEYELTLRPGDIGLVLSDGITDVLDSARIVEAVIGACDNFPSTLVLRDGHPEGANPGAFSIHIAKSVLACVRAERERLQKGPVDPWGCKWDDILLMVFVVGGDPTLCRTAEYTTGGSLFVPSLAPWPFTRNRLEPDLATGPLRAKSSFTS